MPLIYNEQFRNVSTLVYRSIEMGMSRHFLFVLPREEPNPHFTVYAITRKRSQFIKIVPVRDTLLWALFLSATLFGLVV